MRCPLKPPNSYRLWSAWVDALSSPGVETRSPFATATTITQDNSDYFVSGGYTISLWWLWCKLLLTPGPLIA